MSDNLDLLGDPIPDGFGTSGRPPHIPTEKNRLKVRMLLALEWKQAAIAAALRITGKTLRKHYSRELQYAGEARLALESELHIATFTKAAAGDASMMKIALKLFERIDIAKFGIPAPSKNKDPKLGKKEQALQDALAPKTDTPLGELLARRQGESVN